jgi:DNA-directed RNA polymerase subunit RPC12/RpoP
MKKEIVNELLSNLKNMVDILQSASDNEEEPKAPVKKKRGRPKKKKQPKIDDDFIIDKQNQSRTPVFVHNKFEDMSDLEIDKPDGYDKINDATPRTKRSRSSYNAVEIKCSECGKKQKINPMFKKDNYVCDRCVGKKFGG